MPVHVKISTTLRACVPGYNPLQGLTMDVGPGETAGSLAARLNLPPEQIKIIMVNGVHALSDTPLANDDRVAYFPAVGGG